MQYPEEILNLRQFVVWKMEARVNGDKPTKIPYNPRTGKKASSRDESTWGTLDDALRAYQSGQYSGIGFEFIPPYAGIDLDNCRDPRTGDIEEWARRIVQDFDSYTEVSPSGKGLHIYVKGTLSGSGLNRSVNGRKIEIYNRGRYFTLTGLRLAETPLEIGRRQYELDALYNRILEQTEKKPEREPPAARQVELSLSDEEVLQKCRGARNAGKFERLWAGDCSDYGGNGRPDGDHSAADLALCSMMAFYTRDSSQLDRLFRASGLYRPKWERADYRGRTIGMALQKSEFYAGPDTTRIFFGGAPYEQGQFIEEAVEEQVNRTDVGNGIRLVRAFGRDLRYCYAWGKWLAWNGAYWQVDDSSAVERMAKETVRGILAEAVQCADPDRRQALAKWAITSESNARIKAMIEMARSEPGVAVTPDDLDGDQYLLNVKNGTLNLIMGELYGPRREDLITRAAGVEYSPEAECPLFLEFLCCIFKGSAEIIHFVQRAIGYSLTGDVSEQKLMVCYGTGANGKSTLLDLIADLVGDFATNIPMESLLYRHVGAGIPNDIAQLRGTRFVSCVETDEGRRLSESLVKQLTGGDRITARFLHQEWFTFKPTFKLWMAVNHRPIITGTDHGIWRRIRLIPFDVTIPERLQDKELPYKLRAEMSGILNWALEGCLAWKRDGLGSAEAVDEATAEYRGEMDRLGAFLEDRCELGDGLQTPSNTLYNAYKQWAEENGIRQPMDSRRFKNSLHERNIRVKKTPRHNVFVGVAISCESGF